MAAFFIGHVKYLKLFLQKIGETSTLTGGSFQSRCLLIIKREF